MFHLQNKILYRILENASSLLDAANLWHIALQIHATVTSLLIKYTDFSQYFDFL